MRPQLPSILVQSRADLLKEFFSVPMYHALTSTMEQSQKKNPKFFLPGTRLEKKVQGSGKVLRSLRGARLEIVQSKSKSTK